ncbi:hypothetical protein LTS16_012895 [Friedmanniomyces endolithicus]|nr:hypothetical protein LTR57_012883 [Friedmanniomyces endolithicus]KAK0957842.1 hypothetical protein LTS01_022166 [Friedmanniomyces endolithicus]KAK1037349.1 hypothetical protein LTS16_012895 [Friedmanniomyces endolithicus]
MGHNYNSRSGHYTSGAGSWADQWNTINSAPTWQQVAIATSGISRGATCQPYINSQAAQFGMLQPSPPLPYTISVPYPQPQRQTNAMLHQLRDDRGTLPMMARPLNYYKQSAGPYRNTIDTPAGVDPAILQLAGDQLQVFSDGEGTSSWETFQGLNTGNLPKSTLSYAEIAQLSNQAIHNVPYQPVNRMSPYTNANTVTMPAPTWRHQNMITQVTPVRLSMHWQPQVIPPPATRHAAKHKYRATYIPPTQADAPPWPLAPGGRAPSRAQRLVPMSRSGSKAESSTTSGRRSKQHTLSTALREGLRLPERPRAAWERRS